MRTVEEQQRGISFRTSVGAIKDAVPLADYAAGLTNLGRMGGRMVGLCPLHEEKTASFYVYPDQHFHCYGCEAHGDVLDLHQLYHGHAEKWEALVSLALERGVELPGRSERWRAGTARKASVEEMAFRVRGAVYKRRAFAILVEPVIGALPDEVQEEERASAWREFGSPGFWARVVGHMRAGAPDGKIRGDGFGVASTGGR